MIFSFIRYFKQAFVASTTSSSFFHIYVYQILSCFGIGRRLSWSRAWSPDQLCPKTLCPPWCPSFHDIFSPYSPNSICTVHTKYLLLLSQSVPIRVETPLKIGLEFLSLDIFLYWWSNEIYSYLL